MQKSDMRNCKNPQIQKSFGVVSEVYINQSLFYIVANFVLSVKFYEATKVYLELGLVRMILVEV